MILDVPEKPDPFVRAEQELRAGSVLDSARERALAAGVPAHTAVRVGSLPETIAAYARENAIDEIVVAVARKTLLGRLFTGSVVNELIAASPVPCSCTTRSRASSSRSTQWAIKPPSPGSAPSKRLVSEA